MLKSNQSIQRFDFQKNKYGKQLLVDLGRVEQLKNYVLDKALHTITFYEILIITKGSGYYSLDNETIKVEPGSVIVSLPNQIRQWKIDTPVQGFCFFFEGDFLNNYFRDEVFLNRFTIFDYRRPLSYTTFDYENLRKLVKVLEEVEGEFSALRGDSSHIFRSLLYYVISLIDRKYKEQHDINESRGHEVVYEFKKTLNSNYHKWHQVSQYAHYLAISQNHLNNLCREQLSTTALKVIQERILLEAKRDLQFSLKTASQIGFNLGFSDVSNFNRMFKRVTGITPHAYRLKMRQ